MESVWVAIGIAVGVFALILFLIVAIGTAQQAKHRERSSSGDGFVVSWSDDGAPSKDAKGSEGGGSWWDAISDWFSSGDAGDAGGDGGGGDGGGGGGD
jgi:hypothetical protein